MKTEIFLPSQEMIFTTVEPDRARLLDFYSSLKASAVSINLEQVEHCDSAGLAFLIEAKRLARRYKKTCKIEGLNDHILALANFCGVEKVLWGTEELK